MRKYVTLNSRYMATTGKGPKTQNKWPGIGVVDKITAFKTPNYDTETLKLIDGQSDIQRIFLADF